MGITKPCTHLHPAPSTSNQFFLAHFSHHPAPCNTLNIIRTKLSHVTGQFGQFFQVSAEKFKVTYLFWLKIGSHDILEVLIPNPDFDFWKYD